MEGEKRKKKEQDTPLDADTNKAEGCRLQKTKIGWSLGSEMRDGIGVCKGEEVLLAEIGTPSGEIGSTHRQRRTLVAWN